MGLDRWWDSRHRSLGWCGGGERSHSHYFDTWSITHVLFGALYTWIPLWAGFSLGYAVLFCICLTLLFEVFENSGLGTSATSGVMRIVCCCATYEGDAFGNSLADVLCNMTGCSVVMLMWAADDYARLFHG